MNIQMSHKVLIVDDEKMIGNALGRLIKRMGAQFVYAESGTAAIEAIKNTDGFFSLIISDQKMPDMKGSVFLEVAKKISPVSVRFLITGYADIHSVVEAVNRGAVHRFITKPWDNAVLMETIKTGFDYHEEIISAQELFSVAKKKNKELFQLNMALKEQASVHKEALQKKDDQLKKLNTRLKNVEDNRVYISEVEQFLKENDLLENNRINAFYPELTAALLGQFEELANRNGFSLVDRIDD